jgi:hypothetical protein
MRPVARAVSDDDSPLLFLPNIFDETLSLLFEAHGHFQDGPEGFDRHEQAPHIAEMTLITMRLTSVMAWIMVRRAVTAGRIDAARAANSYRLEGVETSACAAGNGLPAHLRQLSTRSLSLFERVARLDALIGAAIH